MLPFPCLWQSASAYHNSSSVLTIVPHWHISSWNHPDRDIEAVLHGVGRGKAVAGAAVGEAI